MNSIPNNITKVHLEKAIEEIDKDGIRKGRHSTTYDLIHKGKSYPPKLVLSLANRYANGTELDPNKFGAGKDTPAFELMKAEGFEIIVKNDPLKSLIVDYKKRITVTKLQDEIYKWQLVNQYRGRPNPETSDFYQEIKGVKFNNLIYAMGVAVVQHIAKGKPEELRQLFINLYDETKDLTGRVKSFNKETLKIYRELEGSLQHHQDERSIATYLTFHNSDKYTFYKYAFYKKYCALLAIKEAPKNEKYTHYLTLVDELIDKYIIPDTELIEQVKELLPDYYNGTNHKLLAQDILYQMLDKKEEISYWIFQGNPKVFDFETALRKEILTDWTVSAHKDKIKVGDKVILWITGDQSGCYALAEITSEPHKKTTASDDHLWKEEDTSELKAGIKITHNLVDSPILKLDIIGEKELEGLKVGHQGTNFNASEEEYLTLLDMVSSQKDSAYQNVINKLDKTLLNEFIKFLRDYVKQKHLDYDDSRIGFNVRVKKDRLVFIIGGRYAFCIEKNNNKTEIKFIHEDPQTNDAKGEFTTNNEIEAYWHRVSTVSKFKHIIKEGLDIELKRGHINPHRKYSNREFIKDIYQKEIMAENKSNQEKSLNTILFGPPGTGKTYHTINKAVEICDPVFYKANNSDRDALKKRYRDLVNVGQVVFTTFHQSTSYEDFIEGIKPKMDDEENTLGYQIEDGVFKGISQKAQDQKNAVVSKSIDIEISKDKFDLPINKLSLGDANDKEDDLIIEYCLQNDCIALGFGEDIDFTGVKDIGDIRHRCLEYGIDVNGSDKFTAEAVKRFLFWMKKGQLVLISNGNRKLRAIAEITGDYYCDPNTPIRYSQFRKVKWLYKDIDLPIREVYGKYFSQQTIYQMHSKEFDQSYFSIGNEENKSIKNHVIIIDEINRGNVSAIFGELITLIEPDKREGNKEALSAILPYSKEPFEVPNNLFIIGTMNTADRSVEALDTALRRRFSFEEMLPKPDLLKQAIKGVSLEDLLVCINERIEALIDRDHTIGHSYLFNVKSMDDLKLAFKDKIIPLLQEYFYGDYGKIGLVLGGGFVKMHAQENEIFADFEYDGSDGLAQNKFELITINEAFDMKEAIKTLLNNSGE